MNWDLMNPYFFIIYYLLYRSQFLLTIYYSHIIKKLPLIPA